MDGVSFLRGQLRHAHELLEAVVADLTPEQAMWAPPGRAEPAGSAYARVLILEDAIVNALLKGGRPLFSTTWDNRVGVSDCMPLPDGLWPDFTGPGWEHYDEWARTVHVGLHGLRRYARAVYAASDEYVASLTPADLDRTIDVSSTGMGQIPLSQVLARVLVRSSDSACGEIDCLKRLRETPPDR